MIKNSIAGRMDFDIACDLFRKAFSPNDLNFDPVTAFRLTQSRLRLEQPIVTTSTLYTFPVLSNIQNQAQQYATEVRLNQQDSFVPTSVGIYVALPNSPSITNSSFKLLSYLNPFVFANADAMLPIYNGVFKIMINNVQYLNNWPVMWHWNSQETQQTSAPGAGSPVDQFYGDESGQKPMQPFVLLLGSQNIQINISLPVACAAVDANARLVVVFDGILAQNSTVVQ